MRFRLFLAPLAGASSCNFIWLHFQQVTHFMDHSSDLWRIGTDDRLPDFPQAEPTQNQAMAFCGVPIGLRFKVMRTL